MMGAGSPAPWKARVAAPRPSSFRGDGKPYPEFVVLGTRPWSHKLATRYGCPEMTQSGHLRVMRLVFV